MNTLLVNVKKILRVLFGAAALTALVSCEDMLNPEPSAEPETKAVEDNITRLLKNGPSEEGFYQIDGVEKTAIDVSAAGNEDLFLDAMAWMTAESGANLTANTMYALALGDGAAINYSGRLELKPPVKGVTLVIMKKSASAAERVIDFRNSGGLGLSLENISVALGAGITLTGENNVYATPLVTVNKGAALELNSGSAIKDYKSTSTTGGAVRLVGTDGSAHNGVEWVYTPVYARLVVRGGSITGCKSNNSGAAVYMGECSEFEMTSGEISGNSSNTTSTVQGVIWTSSNTSVIKISGGTLDNAVAAENSADIMMDISSNGSAGVHQGGHPRVLTLAGNPKISGIAIKASAMYSSCIWLEKNYTGSGTTFFIQDPSPTRWFTTTETYGGVATPFTRVVLKWADENAKDEEWQGGRGPYPVGMFKEIKYYYYSWSGLQDFAAKNYHLDAQTGRFEPNQ